MDNQSTRENKNIISTERESSSVAQASLSWRAILAGAFLSLLFYFILMALGVAIGGSLLPGVIRGQVQGGGLGIGSGIWMIVSLIVSLFFGAYLSSRVSGLRPIRVGGTQGLIITALFFAVTLSGLGSVLGGLGRSVGVVAASTVGAAGDLSQNPTVRATVQDALKGLNLNAPPAVVARGVAVLLLEGDETGARNFLAEQAGISPSDAEQRIQGFKDNFQGAVQNAGVKVAKATSAAAWTVFGALILSSFFAWLGGALGMRVSLARPLSERELEIFRESRAA